MAKRISELPALTLPALTDQFEVNQGGVSKRVPLSQVRNTDWFNVKDYGAVGDGVADDTAAIQAAVTATLAGPRRGGVVYGPLGTYKITSTITLPDPDGGFQDAISIWGDGPTLTKFVWGGGTGSEVALLDVLGQAYHSLRGFSLINTQGRGALVGLWLRGDGDTGGTAGGISIIEQVSVSGCKYGTVFGDPENAVSEILLRHVTVNDCDFGLFGTNLNSLDFTCEMLVMSGNTTGVRMYGAGCLQVYGGSASDNGTDFHFTTGGAFLVSGFRSEGAATLFLNNEGGTTSVQGCTVASSPAGISIASAAETLTVIGSDIAGKITVMPNTGLSLIGNRLGCGGDGSGALVYQIASNGLAGVTVLKQNNVSIPSLNGTFRFANAVAA